MANGTTARRSAGWLSWVLLVVMVLMAFELTIIGAAFQGRWFILLAPAAACGWEAWTLWRRLTGRDREFDPFRHDSR